MLKAGTRLDHYAILDKIGQGGMGEVYEAEDTRLQRKVALKILPADLAKNPERKQRFEQEARTVSKLKHPHICVLHDIGRDQEVDYLVMELVEGETLLDRLRRGPLPLKEALRTAVQIAEALDAAHRHGIVHRDLKPGNVMLTRAGAKLLDFGLAKISMQEGDASVDGAGSDSAAATRAAPLTGEGTVLGTVQYMSPEQLEGRTADARSDLFALGALLYEMLSGKPAFQGESKASLITAIMSADPDPLGHRLPGMPPLLDRILAACLSKDPEERFQSAHDLARDLRWIAQGADSGSGAAEFESRAPIRRSGAWRLVAASMLSGLLALLVGYFVWSGKTAQGGRGVVRAVVPLGEPVAQGRGRRSPVAISPDGRRIAFVATKGDGTVLKVRAIDRFESSELPNTEGAEMPFFSPDGRWIGYFGSWGINRVPVSGGMPTRIVDAPDVRGAVWLPDDTIVYTPHFSEGLFRIPASGGSATRLTTPDWGKDEKTHRWPSYLPEANAILFTVGSTQISSFGEARIDLLSLDSGERKTVVTGGSSPVFLDTGHLVYGRNGSLLAAQFDIRDLALAGTPTTVIDGVSTSPTYGTAAFSVSADGGLVYVPGSGLLGNGTLVWVDREGNVSPVTTERRDYLGVSISPDGVHLNLELGGANDAVWAYDLERGVMTRLTFAGDVSSVISSSDGKQVAFTVPQPLEEDAKANSGEEVGYSVYRVAADGSGVPELLGRSEHERSPTSWSPDGRAILMTENNPDTDRDIWILPIDSNGEPGEPRAFLKTRFAEMHGRFSPDGRWVAFTSTESGRAEIQVRSFPEGDRKVLISRDGGLQPRWRGDGRELFFRVGDQVMAVDIETAGGFKVGTPHILFEVPMQGDDYEVSADGRRFLMVQVDEASSPENLNLVLGWTSEIATRLP